MPDYRRYAIYYAPPAGSELARFGASWLGWDPEAEVEVPHPPVNGLDVAAMTANPRRYGFHGTLKPPFRLAQGVDPTDLERALTNLTGRTAAFRAARLALCRMGRFLALAPARPSADMAALAARCVMDLDEFRAPPDEAELQRRRQSGLNTAQEENLVRWGYPYVLAEFRFHLTLTGPIEDELALTAMGVLGPLTAPFCASPFEVREVCLFGEHDDGRFHLIRHYPLTG